MTNHGYFLKPILKKYGRRCYKVFQNLFAAPPLINGLLKAGELDAGINYWNYVAILEAQGFKTLLTLEDIYPILGIKGDLPLIGYTLNEELAKSNKNLLERFLKATNESRKILETSDQEWLRLKKLTGARSDQMLITLRDGFRKGIPR